MKYRKSAAKTPQGILRAAARIIRKHGWLQNEYFDQYGRVCLLGSINAAVTGDPTSEPRSVHDAVRLVEERIRSLPSTSHFESADRWNDGTDRKVEDVLAILEV